MAGAETEKQAGLYPFDPLESYVEDPALWADLPLEVLVRFSCVPIRRFDDRTTMAFAAPCDLQRVDEAEFFLSRPLEPILAPPGSSPADSQAPSQR